MSVENGRCCMTWILQTGSGQSNRRIVPRTPDFTMSCNPRLLVTFLPSRAATLSATQRIRTRPLPSLCCRFESVIRFVATATPHVSSAFFIVFAVVVDGIHDWFVLSTSPSELLLGLRMRVSLRVAASSGDPPKQARFIKSHVTSTGISV